MAIIFIKYRNIGWCLNEYKIRASISVILMILLYNNKYSIFIGQNLLPCPVRVYCRHCSAGQPRPGCSGSILGRSAAAAIIFSRRPTIKLDIGVLQLLSDRLCAIKNHSKVVPKNLKFSYCRKDRFF